MKTYTPKIVILTGPIASGKSTVRELFNSLNVPNIDADKIVHAAYTNKESTIYKNVVLNFGFDILDENSNISRTKLKSKINTDDDLKLLESLVSPSVLDEFRTWTSIQNTPYILWEVPLYTKAWFNACFVVVVHVSQKRQYTLFEQRGNSTKDTFDLIKQSQRSTEQYLEMADAIIDNNGDLQSLREQVINLHNLLLGEHYG